MKKLEIEAQQEIPHQLRYIHGLDASIDLEQIKIIGRPPRPVQVQKDKQHWITWDSLYGEVRLTPKAASQIARTTNNWVILDFDEKTKISGSTVYAIGIKDASPHISPNDEVLLFDEDKSHLLGVGIALISGSTMNEIRSGPCIKIRKKDKIEV
jgi:predicted RNA-binding protein (TIGR00451 family)